MKPSLPDIMSQKHPETKSVKMLKEKSPILSLKDQMLDESISSLQIKLARESTKSIQLEIEIDAKDTRIKTLADLSSKLQLDLNAVHAQKLDLSKQIDSLNMLLDSQKDDHAQSIKNLHDSLAIAHEQLNDKSILISELSDIVSTLQSQVDTLKNQPALHADVWIQQVVEQEFEQKLMQKNQLIESLQSDLALSNDQLADCYSCIDLLEKDNQKIPLLENEILSTESLLYSINREREIDANVIKETQNALAESLSENKQLHSLLDESKESAINQQTEISECYQVIDILESQEKELLDSLNACQLQIETLQLDLQTAQIQLKVANDNVQTLESDKSELTSALKETLEENKSLSMAAPTKSLADSYAQTESSKSIQPTMSGKIIQKTVATIQTDLDYKALQIGQDALLQIKETEFENQVYKQEAI
jgi:chromosome segregation ATPase